MTDLKALSKALRSYQQADEEGIMVLVSRQAIEEAAAFLDASGWHSVEDVEPPKDGTQMLLYCVRDDGTGFQITGYWDAGSVEFKIPGEWKSTSHDTIYPPSFWMPLPTPPKETTHD